MNQREIAYKCLCEILIEGKFSNIVLKNCKDNTAFITQLVYGTLRYYRLLEALWAKYANNQPPKKVAVLLDMAEYELLFLDSENYACVNEAVEIAKKIKSGAYKNFVNAILRKVKKQDIESLSYNERLSHPDWLINLWTAHYGKEVCEKICLQDLKDARVSLRVNNLKTNSEELLKDEKFFRSDIEDCLYYKGNIVESKYFKENLVIIQSLSSQLAVKTLQVQKGSRVLDICAAPGSKTIQMAMDMENTGSIVANDIYDFRVKLIGENVKKYGITNVELTNYDGRDIDKYFPLNSFDYVLLDAPCSGLGTLRHKPEIKITTKPTDLDSIVALQKELLKVAKKMVKKGGYLMYSTCTLNKKENEKQVEAFLKENQDFSLVSSQTIFPFDYDSDGFYIAKLLYNSL